MNVLTDLVLSVGGVMTKVCNLDLSHRSRWSSSSGLAVVEQFFCCIVVSVQGAGLSEDDGMNSVLCCDVCRISCYLQLLGIRRLHFIDFRTETSSFYSGDELNIVISGARECFFFFFKGTNHEGKQRMICDWLSSTCEIGK